jgi:ribosome maturation protein SDO1
LQGQAAKDEDVEKVIGLPNNEEACKEILRKGELQVSEKERKASIDSTFKDVVSTVVSKCVNPQTDRPFPSGVIEKALKDIHFNVNPKRSAKQQALDVIPKLKERFHIERAQMQLVLKLPADAMDQVRMQVLEHSGIVEQVDNETSLSPASQQCSVTVRVDPGGFRQLDSLARARGGRLEVLALAAVEEGSASAGGAASSERAEKCGSDRGITSHGIAGAGSGYAAERQHAIVEPRREARANPESATASSSVEGGAAHDDSSLGDVVVSKRSIQDLPEKYESRRERFSEIDSLQSGWQVELRARSDQANTLDAVFYDPDGSRTGTFAQARRQALQASKATPE